MIFLKPDKMKIYVMWSWFFTLGVISRSVSGSIYDCWDPEKLSRMAFPLSHRESFFDFFKKYHTLNVSSLQCDCLRYICSNELNLNKIVTMLIDIARSLCTLYVRNFRFNRNCLSLQI